jgi:hypothetical protein
MVIFVALAAITSQSRQALPLSVSSSANCSYSKIQPISEAFYAIKNEKNLSG